MFFVGGCVLTLCILNEHLRVCDVQFCRKELYCIKGTVKSKQTQGRQNKTIHVSTYLDNALSLGRELSASSH